MAGWLSGERAERQFVSDSFVTPYESLPTGAVLDHRAGVHGRHAASAPTCSKSYRTPEQAKLQPFDPKSQTFTAQADCAVNLGFAMWIPPGQGAIDGDTYHQIYSENYKPDMSPGATSAGGSKTVAWTYHASLLDDLPSYHVGKPHAPARVVVMAIPCIADNLPAETKVAAVATYDIASGKDPLLQPHNLRGYDVKLLAHAACQANT
ncbi:hypothetical protein ABZV93_28520 [Actinopolymorpha sp. NPDC004070]|uniref:hypothetical protein n=1 Tax=Actinopolymorpha sp. NPDC004070 TaxID=3154548 RepID=UPI0033AF29E2